jgi:hypothetical protein
VLGQRQIVIALQDQNVSAVPAVGTIVRRKRRPEVEAVVAGKAVCSVVATILQKEQVARHRRAVENVIAAVAIDPAVVGKRDGDLIRVGLLAVVGLDRECILTLKVESATITKAVERGVYVAR